MITLEAALDELDAIATRTARIRLPNDDLLDRYEEEIGIKFPQDYREMIKRENNAIHGRIDIYVITEPGARWPELREGVASARLYGVPKDWLPVCEDNANFYCLTPDNDVKYWSHDNPWPPYESWPSLGDWIKKVWIDGE